MGLDTASALLLSAAKSIGADFTDVIMIGRQHFHPRADVLAQIFSRFRIAEDAGALAAKHEYAERFFELMGAARVESLDFSGYEGATYLHDLNLPVPLELRGKYSIVHDGGTLEHVFNITQALKNCMEMVRVGGYFTQVNCANNFMGHGFWQFSPELIFRVFSSSNGFRVKVVLLHEVVRGGRWVVVSDPAAVRRRVWLQNNVPTYILTIAQRIRDQPTFASFPQQSDYEAVWGDPDWQPDRSKMRKPSFTKEPVARLKRLGSRLFRHPQDGFYRPFFRQVAEDDVLFGRF
jgi:hypothetical protein